MTCQWQFRIVGRCRASAVDCWLLQLETILTFFSYQRQLLLASIFGGNFGLVEERTKRLAGRSLHTQGPGVTQVHRLARDICWKPLTLNLSAGNTRLHPDPGDVNPPTWLRGGQKSPTQGTGDEKKQFDDTSRHLHFLFIKRLEII
jgi:hypothetical protein